MTTSIRKHSSRASLNSGSGNGSLNTSFNGPSSLHDSSSPSSSSSSSSSSLNNNTTKPPNLIQILRIILAAIYLILIVLTIPLSFELGGINCGLSFTFTILVLYFFLTTLRVFNSNRLISSFLYYSQHLLLPSLLFLFISIFKDSDYKHTYEIYEELDPDTDDKLIKFEMMVSKIWWDVIIRSWKFFLINSTPLFTILEGFCSLLLIQSVGQTSKWLQKHKSETWSIVSLLSSGIITTTLCFFLFKIYVFPINLTNIGLISLSLLGSILTFTLVVTLFGLITGKSTTIESSLIFSYIIKSIYEIFPELSQMNYNNFQDLIKFILDELYKINEELKNKNWFLLNNETPLNKLSSLIFAKYSESTVSSPNYFLNIYHLSLKFITKNFPSSFLTLWDFLKLAVINLTLPIILSLFYRIGVFFALTKIIPILQPLANNSQQNQLQGLKSPIHSLQSSPKLSPQFNNAQHIPKSSSNSSILSLKGLDDEPVITTVSASSSNSSSLEASGTQTTSSNGNILSDHQLSGLSPQFSLSSTSSTTSYSNSASHQYSRTTRLIYLFSPSIIITVYTNLMIQYNNKIDDIPMINWLLKDFLNDGVHIWQFWHWVNVFLFLMLYTIELVLN